MGKARRERLLQTIIDTAPYGVTVLDEQGRLLTINRSGLAMCEADSVGQLRRLGVSAVVDPAYRAAFRAMHAAALAGERQRLEYELVGLRGTRRWLESHAVPLPADDDPARIDAVLSVTVDITERRRAEKALRDSEARLKLVFAHTSDHQVLWAVGDDGRFYLEAFNSAAVAAVRLQVPDFDPERLLGREHAEVMGAIHRPAGASDEFHAGARAALASRRPEQVVITPAPDLTLEATFVPVFDDAGRGTHILWTARDVTRETQGRARIAAQLAEKETLLREVHHRVKNNLQIVTSLLSLQQHAVDSPDVAMMLEESRRRVAAMALVHEHLYAADVLAEVDMASYVRRLSTSLVASFGTLPSRVELRLAGTSFPLPMERAIPCGLLLNELLTNALKHAFPGDRRGSITVRLDREDAADTIDVRDDGVGFAPDLESTPRSLGLQLLPRLAAQLGGSLERGQDAPGTQYRLRLPRRA